VTVEGRPAQEQSWTPPLHESPPPDDRVEACRDRAAELRDAHGRRAQLYCRIDTGWTLTGGHAWWRRWSAPHHQLEGLWFEDDEPAAEFVCSGEELAATLDDLDRGVIVFQGAEWQVQWMDDRACRAFRERHGFDVHR
jgi:hypothetical protein